MTTHPEFDPSKIILTPALPVPDVPFGTELLYRPGESLFGANAMRMHRLGWTVFPQERDDRRKPARIDGRALKWSKWYDAGPSTEDIARWALQAASSNTAIILGPASGDTFCADVDILDEYFSLDVQQIAKEILGETPFRRVGKAPKIALFYRSAPGELPRNARHAFELQAGETEAHAIEILARAKAITAYGYHHGTGEYFTWLDEQPMFKGPEAAPLVTPDQLQAFIDACGRLRPFIKPARAVIANGAAFDGALEVSTDGWIIPGNRTAVERDAAGLINGGREPWLTAMSWDLVRLNPGRVAHDMGNSTFAANPAGVEAAIHILRAHAAEHLNPAGWSKDVNSEIADKVSRAAEALVEGRIKKLGRVRRVAGKVYADGGVTLEAAAVDPALAMLPARDKRKKLDIAGKTAADPVKAAERALKLDRTETAASVSQQVEAGLQAFSGHVYGTRGILPAVHVLLAPTGAGKSSRAISYIAEDPRTYSDDDLPADSEDRKGPLLFLLPTYANIDELRARAEAFNLDASLDDEQLALEAKEIGVLAAENVDEEIQRLQAEAGPRLNTMVYRGKLAAGCQQEEKMRMVLDAGISSSGLCEGRKKLLGGGWEKEYCPFYQGCPAIQQRKQIATSHVVFMPHSFLNLKIPEELEKVRAVVADERIFTLFVHTTRFKLETLDRARKSPKLTKKEEKAGLNEQELIDDRIMAARIVYQALLAGRDPVADLADFKEVTVKKTITGLSLVRSAMRICGGASSANVSVYPTMSLQDLLATCAMPTGLEVGEEYRFWKIVVERLKAMAEGIALHEREDRIQLLRHADSEGNVTPLVRISWITQPNWPSAPVLLLDASANEKIVQKIFPGRPVVMHDIEADLNLKIVAVTDRSYSTSGLVPHADGSETQRLQAARRLDLYRDARNAICSWHANGRVLETSMKSVREVNSRAYVAPINLDQIHLGAERGLDFAKQHIASIGLGRMELPVWIQDGLAAALAATDPEPAVLLDPLGTGCDDKGQPLMPALGDFVLPMRDGSDATIIGAKNPDGWQRIVQEQFREEGLKQGAIGRMRPVYREDTPVVYLMATCIPDGIIVDEICSLEDLIPSYAPLLDAARYNGGIICWALAGYTRNDLGSPEAFLEQFRALPAELKAGYTVVRYTVKGHPAMNAGVPAIVEDPVGHLKRQVQWAGLQMDGEPEIVRAAEKARVAPAAERKPDALELALGMVVERRLTEDLGRKTAAEALPAFMPGQGRYKGKGDTPLSLTAWALLQRSEGALSTPGQDYMEKEAI